MDLDDAQQRKHMSRQMAESLMVLYVELRKAQMPRLLAFMVVVEHYKFLVSPPNPMDAVAQSMLEMIEATQRREDDDE